MNKTLVLVVIVAAIAGSGIYLTQRDQSAVKDVAEEGVNGLEEQDNSQNETKEKQTSKDTGSKTASICGNLILSAGAPEYDSSGPVSEAIQILDTNYRVVMETKSSSDGKFEVAVVPGNYVIAVPKFDHRQKIAVSEGKCDQVNVVIAFPSSGF